jgi:hypothetical protein
MDANSEGYPAVAWATVCLSVGLGKAVVTGWFTHYVLLMYVILFKAVYLLLFFCYVNIFFVIINFSMLIISWDREREQQRPWLYRVFRIFPSPTFVLNCEFLRRYSRLRVYASPSPFLEYSLTTERRHDNTTSMASESQAFRPDSLSYNSADRTSMAQRWMASFMSWSFYPGERTSSNHWIGGMASQPVWTLLSIANSLVPGIETQPSRS